MPTNRQADQMIGADLYQALVASGSYAVGTYHVGLQPTGAQTGSTPFQTTQQALVLKTGAPTPADGLNSAGKYLDLIIDVTVHNGGTVTVTIVGADPVSGKVFNILVSTALAVAATTVLRVGPTYTAAANL